MQMSTEPQDPCLEYMCVPHVTEREEEVQRLKRLKAGPLHAYESRGGFALQALERTDACCYEAYPLFEKFAIGWAVSVKERGSGKGSRSNKSVSDLFTKGYAAKGTGVCVCIQRTSCGRRIFSIPHPLFTSLSNSRLWRSLLNQSVSKHTKSKSIAHENPFSTVIRTGEGEMNKRPYSFLLLFPLSFSTFPLMILILCLLLRHYSLRPLSIIPLFLSVCER